MSKELPALPVQERITRRRLHSARHRSSRLSVFCGQKENSLLFSRTKKQAFLVKGKILVKHKP